MALAWCRDAGLFTKMFGDVLRNIQRIPKPEDRGEAPLTIGQLSPCFFLFAGRSLLIKLIRDSCGLRKCHILPYYVSSCLIAWKLTDETMEGQTQRIMFTHSRRAI